MSSQPVSNDGYLVDEELDTFCEYNIPIAEINVEEASIDSVCDCESCSSLVEELP